MMLTPISQTDQTLHPMQNTSTRRGSRPQCPAPCRTSASAAISIAGTKLHDSAADTTSRSVNEPVVVSDIVHPRRKAMNSGRRHAVHGPGTAGCAASARKAVAGRTITYASGEK